VQRALHDGEPAPPKLVAQGVPRGDVVDRDLRARAVPQLGGRGTAARGGRWLGPARTSESFLIRAVVLSSSFTSPGEADIGCAASDDCTCGGGGGGRGLTGSQASTLGGGPRCGQHRRRFTLRTASTQSKPKTNDACP
jgi:hypothetical protein